MKDRGGSEQRTQGGSWQCGWGLNASSTQGPGRLALWVRNGAAGVLRAHGEAGRTPKPPPAAAVLVCRSQETGFGSDGQLLVSKQNRVRCPKWSPKERTSFWGCRRRKRKI